MPTKQSAVIFTYGDVEQLALFSRLVNLERTPRMWRGTCQCGRIVRRKFVESIYLEFIFHDCALP